MATSDIPTIISTYNLKDILLTDINDDKWLINNILPDKSIIALYGQPGCGKSFLCIDIAFHIIYNKSWCNNNISKDIKINSSIIYIIGEGLNGCFQRIKTWLDYHNISNIKTNKFHLVPVSNFSLLNDNNFSELISILKSIIKTNSISLIIIDTLARCTPNLDENDSTGMKMFISKIDYLQAIFDCSILIVHHSGKDVKKGMRGSNSLLGAVDTCINLVNNNNVLSFNIQKQKEGQNLRLLLDFIKYKESMIILHKQLKPIEYTHLQQDISNDNTLDSNNIDIACIKNNHGKKWSDSDISKLLSLIKNGSSLQHLSSELLRKNSAIISKLCNIILHDKDTHQLNLDNIKQHYNITNDDLMKKITIYFNKYKHNNTTS